jgi:hypothetical protein
MTTFLALYRGETVRTAKLVAVTVDPTLVREVASHMLDYTPENADAILREVENGRRRALQRIQGGQE